MIDHLPRTEILTRLKTVKLLTLDVDGVLTDGGLYYLEDGSEIRKFNVKDGMGIKNLRKAGVEVAIISASTTNAIQERGKRLGLDYVYTGATDKFTILDELCRTLAITLDQVAHVGDDLNDIPIFEKIGVPLTVADGVDAVKAATLYATERKGGEGAVREICDMIISTRAG